VEGERITTCVTAPYQVGWYLQYISLIANADLYPNYDPKGNVYERGESDRSLFLKASPDYSMIREAITQYQSVSYDEHKGIFVGLGLIYLGNSTSARYLFTTAADGIVTIRDYSNSYHEGAIFENYLCYHDDLTECQEQIERIACRFGGVCDGREVTATFRNDQEDAFVRALCRYAQMAVILAQVGYHIPLDSEPN
jgi:hypothetical protein